MQKIFLHLFCVWRACRQSVVKVYSRQVDKERLASLSREFSQAVSSAAVTTNCEKSAEAVADKVLKWILSKG